MQEKETRRETVTVGANRYVIETAIDPDTWGRIMAFTDDFLSKMDGKTTPDRLLLLAWLNLVYGLDKRHARLRDMAASVDRELNS